MNKRLVIHYAIQAGGTPKVLPDPEAVMETAFLLGRVAAHGAAAQPHRWRPSPGSTKSTPRWQKGRPPCPCRSQGEVLKSLGVSRATRH
jgi:hypothetical protein